MATVSISRMETIRNVHVDIEELASHVEGLLGNLSSLSPVCCIYEVPETHRKINEEAHTPLSVSIGPFHHGKGPLQAMEYHKLRCLKDLLERSGNSLKVFIEKRTRQCYAENILFSSNEFVKMLLLDAAFIIGFLLRNCFPWIVDENDPIFRKPRMILDVNRDLKLLENQLPFFVLEDLFEMANIEVDNLTFIQLTSTYFMETLKLDDTPEERIDTSEVKHFVDFMRSCFVPNERKYSQPAAKIRGKLKFIRCAIELHKAGVKVEKGPSKNTFDISFSGGVLKVPRIEIPDETECLLRNLVAFEQCHYRVCYMSDFVVVMNNLIASPEDVELLVQRGVIENSLGDSEDVSNLFKKLSNEIILSSDQFYFFELYKELNRYCTTPWTRCAETLYYWKATLRRDYFTTPWRALSVFVAFSILVLTFIQAVCSLLSVHK